MDNNILSFITEGKHMFSIKMTKGFAISVTIILLLGMQSCDRCLLGEQKPARHKKQLEITQLNEMEIIGPLSVPIGQFLIIEGKIIGKEYQRTKFEDSKILVRVTKVNNKNLDKEVIVELVNSPKYSEGSKIRIKGFQSGGFVGSPNSVVKENQPLTLISTVSFHFRTTFEFEEDLQK